MIGPASGKGVRVLVSFLILVVGGGLGIGALTVPGTWYAGLAKPAFNPPNWIFGPVWTCLYVLIAIAGSRTYRRDRRGVAMKAWWTQLALNFAWPVAFFAAHAVAAALVVVLALLGTIVAFMVASRRPDPVVAWLFAPYAAWVAFATVLNGSILALN